MHGPNLYYKGTLQTIQSYGHGCLYQIPQAFNARHHLGFMASANPPAIEPANTEKLKKMKKKSGHAKPYAGADTNADQDAVKPAPDTRNPTGRLRTVARPQPGVRPLLPVDRLDPLAPCSSEKKSCVGLVISCLDRFRVLVQRNYGWSLLCVFFIISHYVQHFFFEKQSLPLIV